MKVRNLICGIFIVIIVSGCGVPDDDYEKLKLENKKLITANEQLVTELDECRYGAEKIIAEVEKAYKEKKYVIARQNIKLLYDKHPESPKNKEFKILLKKVEKGELLEKKRKEAKEKERIRLANINNTGIWTVGHYVDEFGEPTKQGFITNSSLITGVFSNTATQDSKLNVRFLISDSTDISIQLYEYAGNNPVKAYSFTEYRILIQDRDGKRLRLKAVNHSDRLTFDKSASKKVHDVLMKGGTIKYNIIEVETPTTEYVFTLYRSDWYGNAYRKLKDS